MRENGKRARARARDPRAIGITMRLALVRRPDDDEDDDDDDDDGVTHAREDARRPLIRGATINSDRDPIASELRNWPRGRGKIDSRGLSEMEARGNPRETSRSLSERSRGGEVASMLRFHRSQA